MPAGTIRDVQKKINVVALILVAHKIYSTLVRHSPVRIPFNLSLLLLIRVEQRVPFPVMAIILLLRRAKFEYRAQFNY